MSGRVNGGGGSGSGDEAKGEGSSASQETKSGSAAPREGAESGGEAKSGDFPVVTLDQDAVQKFAEIEVRWGELRLIFSRIPSLGRNHSVNERWKWLEWKSTATNYARHHEGRTCV